VGIDPVFLPHVFDRFRQADASPTRRYAGLGLGLAIAKQLVELHGGTITVASEGVGRGASFVVHLPLEPHHTVSGEPAVKADGAATADAKGVANGGGALEDASALQGIEVLLVEDEALSSAATARLLDRFGAQVRTADSAARAREAYELHRPDVIVADVGMPDEDGYTLLAGLRRREQRLGGHRTPAIAVTAFARGEDRQRALAAGFDDHLSKPVDAAQLIALLVRLARKVS
jgi:CheY-like chemotaxis protein